ncbi:hypothetical protein PH562_22870 [Rhizobium sp. CNPSo 4062]|uniref:hypothetical protein n=1 Tax=Rhizobium sp. CNPSo 4062 TaxID=3021410 RepID=UPI00254CDCAB|nr:hypothetical protein [Rhizobium sp. CNPSo 4062]MDK4705111.1 hypothetical protein [Rhizobium sp. CNPSo 4062]
MWCSPIVSILLGPPASPLTGQVCGTADLPEAKLARILAWLHEKFTRNFSVGKDLWELVKTHPNDPFFKQFRTKTAILLIRTAVAQLSAITSFTARRIAMEPPPIPSDATQFPEWHRPKDTRRIPHALKRPAAGWRL